MKFDFEEEVGQDRTIDSKEINAWIEKNRKRMKELTVTQPVNWVEGNCSA